jgi:hypothetical protein
MKKILYILLGLSVPFSLWSQPLPGFKISGSFLEQQMMIENSPPDTRILINAPMNGFGKKDQVLLIFYALPNGNTIEQTFGKERKDTSVDWHFDIQNIGAQTRYLRQILKKQTVVLVYVESKKKSWPLWVTVTPDSVQTIRRIVDDISEMFEPWHPRIVMNGHSGGGRFIFSYINAVIDIPEKISRIAFLDSNYGYEDTLHGPKIAKWLKSNKQNYLCTLAYNDSIVIYEGKLLVSPTGGTWYRSKMMERYLSGYYHFRKREKDSLIWYKSSGRRIEIILRPNPDGKILHTVQVERNGFIQSILSGTKYEGRKYKYFGGRVYSDLISDTLIIPIRRLNIPARKADAESGTDFMKRIEPLDREAREEEIYKAVSSGNIPGFLRNTVTLKGEFSDSAGVIHTMIYEAMPDYISVGNDSDFYRIPMNPYTAQRIADLFGGSLLTSKLSDHIYSRADIKLAPFNYVPVGNANELVTKFEAHNQQIEKQFVEAGGRRGDLVAGIKKDVILSARIADQPGKVVIYGWHKPDGNPIQPVYSGHIWWYVDYSHGIRLINDQIILDGKTALVSEILQDPVLFKILNDETISMKQVKYVKQ